MEALYVIGGMIVLAGLVFGILWMQVNGKFRRKNKR